MNDEIQNEEICLNIGWFLYLKKYEYESPKIV